MSSSAGSDSGGGGNDMQVSGAEAAYSKEKGISTAADTKISNTSFSRRNEAKDNRIDYATDDGNLNIVNIGYGDNEVDPRLAEATLGPDTSTVGIMNQTGNIQDIVSGNSSDIRDYSSSEIEKGYTDEGQILANVNGTYMTKADMYNSGIIEKDPITGKDVMGRNKIDPETGELVRADLTFAEHMANAPIKFPPLLAALYGGAKNLQEYLANRNFMGYNEAGQRGKLGNASDMSMDRTPLNTGDSGRDEMNFQTPSLAFAVGNTTPTASMVDNYFSSLNTSGVQTAYDDAKSNLNMILTPLSSQFGYSASPYGAYSMTNLADNPFNIPYMKDRGLI